MRINIYRPEQRLHDIREEFRRVQRREQRPRVLDPGIQSREDGRAEGLAALEAGGLRGVDGGRGVAHERPEGEGPLGVDGREGALAGGGEDGAAGDGGGEVQAQEGEEVGVDEGGAEEVQGVGFDGGGVRVGGGGDDAVEEGVAEEFEALVGGGGGGEVGGVGQGFEEEGGGREGVV